MPNGPGNGPGRFSTSFSRGTSKTEYDQHDKFRPQFFFQALISPQRPVRPVSVFWRKNQEVRSKRKLIRAATFIEQLFPCRKNLAKKPIQSKNTDSADRFLALTGAGGVNVRRDRHFFPPTFWDKQLSFSGLLQINEKRPGKRPGLFFRAVCAQTMKNEFVSNKTKVTQHTFLDFKKI